jgi:hypothetical protein
MRFLNNKKLLVSIISCMQDEFLFVFSGQTYPKSGRLVYAVSHISYITYFWNVTKTEDETERLKVQNNLS